ICASSSPADVRARRWPCRWASWIPAFFSAPWRMRLMDGWPSTRSWPMLASVLPWARPLSTCSSTSEKGILSDPARRRLLAPRVGGRARRALGHIEPLLPFVEVAEHRPLCGGRRRGASVHVLVERQLDPLLGGVADHAERVVALLHALDLLAQHLPEQDDAAVGGAQVLFRAVHDPPLRLPGHAVLRPDRLQRVAAVRPVLGRMVLDHLARVGPRWRAGIEAGGKHVRPRVVQR